MADYPSSPRRAQALSDLGLAYLNLGDKEKSLRYYDMVVETAPQSSEAKGAMEGIREIYVSEGRVDDYFDYAQKAGHGERPDSHVARLAIVCRRPETLPGRADRRCRQVAAQLCQELPQGILPERCPLFPERLLPPHGRARRCHRNPHRTGRAGYEPVFGHGARETFGADL
ncbi:MAG: tetratricopeptide repeat protein [Alistipes finegoldii]